MLQHTSVIMPQSAPSPWLGPTPFPPPHWTAASCEQISSKERHNRQYLDETVPALPSDHDEAKLTGCLCDAGKQAKAKAASRSPASPVKSVGSGSTSKGRGTKQAGRRRSRESKEDGNMEMGEEEEEAPSPKR